MARVNHNTLQFGELKVTRDASGNITMSHSNGATFNLTSAEFDTLVREVPTLAEPLTTDDEAKAISIGSSPPFERQRSSQSDKDETHRLAEAKRVADAHPSGSDARTAEAARVVEAKRVADAKHAEELAESKRRKPSGR